MLDDGEGEGIEDADGDYCLRPLSPRPMSPRSPKLQRKKPVHSHFEKRVVSFFSFIQYVYIGY